MYPDFECFYEKVIKVKADVAALLDLFSDVSIGTSDGDLRGSQGRPEGAFVLTLGSPVSHFTIELGTKRNAVQLSFVH